MASVLLRRAGPGARFARAARGCSGGVGALRSPWARVEAAPADPILGVVSAFKADTDPRKVNLAQGAYRTEEGKPLVLDAVSRAEAAIANDRDLNKEYLEVEGHVAFRELSAAFVFGDDCPALADGRVATVQTISGTGALRVVGEWLAIAAPSREIWMSSTSYGNHPRVFSRCGLDVRYFSYLDSRGIALDFDAMVADLRAEAPKGPSPGAAILLQACAHNPTGVDPSRAQWDELAQLCLERGLLPVFDSAYQGFATGDPDSDAYAVRAFMLAGLMPMVCTSFAKSMGLYGERAGALSIVCGSSSEAAAVLSQVKQCVIRPMYTSPPLHPARLASAVMGDSGLRALWFAELRQISGRILRVRRELTAELHSVRAGGAGYSWDHIQQQVGMFAFTGLQEKHVSALQADHRVYLTRDGRLSLAGLSSRDIPYVAACIERVMR